ncbi:MAG: flagellar basal body-associated FliL family protein [Phycisphaerae bacterium]|nr:flagellar basal body-associated FliL family protein [Phycisphaerae bacterium]
MADEPNEATEQQQEQDDAPAAGGSGPVMMIVLVLATVAVASGAGVALRAALGGAGGDGKVTKPDEPEVPDLAEDTEFEYYEFTDIVVNANVPRRNRVIRATVTLAVGKKRWPRVREQITKMDRELQNWLRSYISGLTPEQIGGEENLNRIREEMCATLNEQLWPDHPGQIHHVLLDAIVQ